MKSPIKKMKFIFLGKNFSIFESNAATNLIYAFSLGFQENGCQSVLLSMGNEYAEPRGFVGEVEYYIPLEQKTRNKHFCIRTYYKLKKYINSIRFCRKIKRKDELNILICFSISPLFIIFSYLLYKMHFDLSFIYLVEHPSALNKNRNRISLSFLKTCFQYCSMDRYS